MKTGQIISLIAHYEIARGIDSDVDGMKGFLAHYLKSLSPAEGRLLKKYMLSRQAAFRRFGELVEKDMATKTPATHEPT